MTSQICPKLKLGNLEPICRNIDLNGLLSEVETLLETQARHKQIDFTVNTQGIKQKVDCRRSNPHQTNFDEYSGKCD